MKAWMMMACALAAAGPAHADDARRRLDLTVPPLLARLGVPSVSIVQIRDGRVSLVVAYGVLADGRRATPATLYNIASMTKPITAEVVLRLAAQGRLDLDAPMDAAWIDPDIADDPRHSLLTPRLALSHRTGFPNWRRQTGGRLTFLRRPGEAYGYSGEGYEYVARFAVRRAGEDLERLAETEVFRPAGMRETSYVAKPWFAGRIAAPTAADGRALQPDIATEPIASDEVYSTPRDYARFMISLMRGRDLPSGLARDRQTVQLDRRAEVCAGGKAASCPFAVGPGLGWEVSVFGERTFLMHTGSDQGEFTFGYFSPTSGEGAIVFTNSANGGNVVLPILEELDVDPAFLRYLHAQVEE
jgi:CubicO group peptidase (beta-lactamase class C family)